MSEPRLDWLGGPGIRRLDRGGAVGHPRLAVVGPGDRLQVGEPNGLNLAHLGVITSHRDPDHLPAFGVHGEYLDHPLRAAGVAVDFLVLYGLRLGEVLGLSWDDIDVHLGKLVVRQQLQRIRGEIFLAPVKTYAGKRELPLLDLARTGLKSQADRQAAYQSAMDSAWPETSLVLTTRTGRPIEPRNLERSFRRICEDNQIPLIKVHHVRHTVGSLLKDLGVPARDAQMILGHTRISTTLEIYTVTDEEARRNALARLHDLFDHGED